MSDIYELTQTDVYIAFELVSIASADIASISVTLMMDGVADIVLTSGDGDISILGQTISIPNDAVTIPGIYRVRMTATDLAGEIHGLKILPNWIKFSES
jgi:hypothetical protein